MTVKPVHLTIGRKTENNSTIPAMAGQFWWHGSEFDAGIPSLRTIFFASGGAATATVELVNLANQSIIVTQTTSQATPTEQVSAVSLSNSQLYEVRIKSSIEGVLVTLGSAELIIS